MDVGVRGTGRWRARGSSGIDHKAVGSAWNPLVGHGAEGTGMKGQVPGAGPLTSAIPVAHLPELGQRDGKALTTLVGLAPWSLITTPATK